MSAGPPPPAPGWARAASAGVLAASFLELAWSTWGRCADVQIDFGRELYVAWRLAAGDVLQRDLAYVFGPLSPHVNAFWFEVLGTSARSLFLGNLAILAVSTALLHQLSARLAGLLAATVAGLTFLAVFAFGHMLPWGTYNHVAPYRHEMTHGFLLGLVAIRAAAALGDSGRLRWALVLGVATGLALLTKVEVAAAVVLAAAGALLTALRSRGEQPAGARRLLASALAGALAALALCWTALALRGGASAASAAFTVLFASTRGSGYVGTQFFLRGAGLLDVGGSLLRLALASAGLAALLAPGFLMAWLLRSRPARVAGLLSAAVVLAGLGPLWMRVDWPAAGRPLPLVALAAAAACWPAWRERRLDPARAGLVLFALGLLPKMLLNARLYHYGFVLAAPATVVLVLALLEWVPRALERRGASAWAFRGAAAALLAVAVFAHLRASGAQLARKTHEVGSGGDRLLDDARATVFADALGVLQGEVRAGTTLVTLPEGATLNYLARLRNPTPHIDFMPSEVGFHGEEAMLAALRAGAPDYVALVHKDTTEYGPRFFGRDYGVRLMAYVREHYEPYALAGDPPLQEGSVFGVLLLKRR